MPLLFILFIIVPIVEIGVFIQVGDQIGLPLTLLIVIVTAILGVNLLKQQGLKSWTKIQTTMTQGQLPALEMASAAQLLFAGGLLLTPGFVTDFIGFSLMIPTVRLFLANHFIKRWVVSPQQPPSQNQSTDSYSNNQTANSQTSNGRIIDGEYEDKTY